jgi:ATP-GRASP peptide maturase of grasp-with-spasm system
MIFILSDDYDRTTDNVINWLLYYKSKFIRVNDTTTIYFKNLMLTNEITDIKINVVNEIDNKEEIVNIADIKIYWYRRGKLNIKIKSLNDNFYLFENNYPEIKNYVLQEDKAINNFFEFYLDGIKKIGSFGGNNINKYYLLLLAKSCDIMIPDSKLVTTKKDLISISKEYELITKCGSGGSGIYLEKTYSATGHTKLLSHEFISNLNDDFFPSFIQKKIEKLFEIRVFCLENKFYAACIFSQNDSKTLIDFRNYNYDKPNRIVPFELPNDLIEKLKKLLSIIDIDACSIDIVINTNNEYVFLEVNPIGQFEFVGIPCNYKLDQKLAKYLIEYDK